MRDKPWHACRLLACSSICQSVRPFVRQPASQPCKCMRAIVRLCTAKSVLHMCEHLCESFTLGCVKLSHSLTAPSNQTVTSTAKWAFIWIYVQKTNLQPLAHIYYICIPVKCVCSVATLSPSLALYIFCIKSIILANSHQTKKPKRTHSAESSHNGSSVRGQNVISFFRFLLPPIRPNAAIIIILSIRTLIMEFTVPPYHQFWWNVFQFHNEINTFRFIIFMV